MKKFGCIATVLVLLFASCSKDGNLNLFSVQDDIDFGKSLDDEILNDQDEYPILDKSENPEAYAYMEGMLAEILQSEEILYRDKFVWQLRIIDKDVMNAFAAPGGYLYFYTGIMKYLETGAAIAGVMAHEVAHADRRHSTESMTKQYGLQVLLDVLLGKEGNSGKQILKDMALGATSLKFSRNHEYEADEYSVRYLADTKSNYNPLGIRVFFDQLERDGYTNETFTFLSTHPKDADRVDNIMKVYKKINSPAGNDFADEHKGIVEKLP